MTRVMVVADCGSPMASITHALDGIAGVEIVRHASVRGALGPMVAKLAPDIVIVDDVHWPALIIDRVAELRRAAPGTAVVVLTPRSDAPWLADALRAGAAVAPTSLEGPTLARLLDEVVADAARHPAPLAA